MKTERKYFIAVDCVRGVALLCTTKQQVAKFFGINISTIQRRLRDGVVLVDVGKYLFLEGITRIAKPESCNNLPKGKPKSTNIKLKTPPRPSIKPMKDTVVPVSDIVIKEDVDIPVGRDTAVVEHVVVPVEPVVAQPATYYHPMKSTKYGTLQVPMDCAPPEDHLSNEYVVWLRKARDICNIMIDELSKPKPAAYDPESVTAKKEF